MTGDEQEHLLHCERVLQMAYEHFTAPAMVSKAEEYLKGRNHNSFFVLNDQQYNIGFADNTFLQKLNSIGDPALLNAALSVGLVMRKDNRAFNFFWDRVMIPIVNKGKIVGFGARAIKPEADNKYINSIESSVFKKGEMFFSAGSESDNTALLVEGYLDAIAISAHGGYSCASMGTAINAELMRELFSSGKSVVILYDGDAPGMKAAKRAALEALTIITPEDNVYVCLLNEGFDPDEYIQEFGYSALLSHIELNKVSLFDFLTPSKQQSLDDLVYEFSKLADSLRDTQNEYAIESLRNQLSRWLPAPLIKDLFPSPQTMTPTMGMVNKV